MIRSVGNARNLPISRVSPSAMSSSKPRATISESCETPIGGLLVYYLINIVLKKHPVKGAVPVYGVVVIRDDNKGFCVFS